MEDDCGERHIRLVYFLANGCTKLCRALVDRLVELSKPHDHKPVDKPWSLDDFLYSYENVTVLSKMKNEPKRKLLFPGRQKQANIHEWDLDLLCFVIMSCTKNSTLKEDVKQLKKIRNSIYHAGNTNIEKVQYENMVKVIEAVVGRCCSEFIRKDDFSKEMEHFLKEFKKGEILRNDADLQKIRDWYENDPEAELFRKVDGLSDEHQLMMTKLEEIVKLLDMKGIILPETNVELIVKNCNMEKEKVISEHLVRLLKSKMTSDISEEVLTAVKDAMSELLSGGRELLDVYHKCVNLKIRCSTFQSMKDLWVHCMTGNVTRIFKPVEKGLRAMVGCPELELEVGITHFEFYRCIEATVMEIAKVIQAENRDVLADYTDLFKEMTLTSDNDDLNNQTIIQNHHALEGARSVEQDPSDETCVVINIQPTQFNQAENLWEACQSERFKKKLESLSQVFEKVYGTGSLQITARMEDSSPYGELFRREKDNSVVAVEDEQKEKETRTDGDLIDFSDSDEDIEDPQEVGIPVVDENSTVESRIQELLGKHQEFKEGLKSLGSYKTKLDSLINEKDEADSVLKELESITSHENKELKRRMEPKREQLISTVARFDDEIQSIENAVDSKKKELRSLLQTMKCYLESIIPDLKTEVRKCQTELVNKHIEFVDQESLETISPWCSDVGYVLYELKETDILRWRQLETGRANTSSASSSHIQCLTFKHIEEMFHDLLQSTMVVSEQSDYSVRLYKKQLPKITIRFLAGDRIDLRAVEVDTMFLQEEEIKFHEEIPAKEMKGNVKLKLPKQIFTRIRTEEKSVVTFDGMEFEQEGCKQLLSQYTPASYFKQLYRFIFYITVEGHTYTTMSLPVIVINEASESCCALASVMWHCFDTDIFSQQIPKKLDLPWLKIAEMLKAKFSCICPTKSLTDENLRHLKRRLLGKESMPDEMLVSLSHFCYEPLVDTRIFSFWKWFLGNYNLVNTYLKQYWEEGLIAGFLSRGDSEFILNQEPSLKSGSFLLRFSDNHITDSQGTRSVFGILTAMVKLKMEVKGGLATRLEAIEVADDMKLRSTNLADILKDSLDKKHVNHIYKYLMPGHHRREDCFDKYCSKDQKLHGYISQQKAILIDMEQEIFAIKNSQEGAIKNSQRTRRNSCSSESGDSGVSSSSPKDFRSLSPVLDSGFGGASSGLYLHPEAALNIPVELSPTISEDAIPDLNSLFSASKMGGTKIVEEEGLGYESEAEREKIVQTLVAQLQQLASSSPEKFSNILSFLLSQFSKDLLVLVTENLSVSNEI